MSGTPKQDMNGRCLKCKKKTIMLVSCSCDNLFCLKCRMPEDHACTFDFQNKGKKILETQNPLVIGSKLNKI